MDVAEHQLRILDALGHPLSPGAPVLDFGCGAGRMVEAFAAMGYDAYGCDIVVEAPDQRIRRIQDPYRLPFEDASFDFVCSDQVLEHVQDHEAAFREIGRVLGPDGATLHFYPSRWRPREVHTHVPLAGVIQAPAWLRAWARVGIRNEFQRGVNAEETTRRNDEFMRNQTNYIATSRMRELAAAHLGDARFVEGAYLATTGGRSRVLRLGGQVPSFAARAFRTLRGPVLFTTRQGGRR